MVDPKSTDFGGFESRKADHIRLALDQRTQNLSSTSFDRVRLKHNSLSGVNFSEISLSTKLLGEEFSSPLFISAMTAGHGESLKINLALASAAAKNNWLMAVGSQRRELEDHVAASEWKNIRKENRSVKLISNIGILELIQKPLAEVLKLIENLEAIGIYVHLNPLQEVFQGNKSLDFTKSLSAIESLVKASPVPVLVKEVGFGIDHTVARRLFDVGVQVVDVSGKGGTHWAQLESLRQDPHSDLAKSSNDFADWGFSSVECLLGMQNQILFHQVWASGGIRSGVDAAKCLALGARAVGIAQPFMKAALESEEIVSKLMNYFDFQLKTSMFCMGLNKCEDFLHQKVWYDSRS